MTANDRHALWARLVTALPVLMTAAAVGLAAVVLSSCQHPSTVATPAQPLRFEGVPTIRVRLTATPVRSITVSTDGPYEVLVDGKVRSRSDARLEKTPLRLRQGRWTLGALSATGKRLSVRPRGRGLVHIDKSIYRGEMVCLSAGTGAFYVQNHLDLESYVASVIARELYARFHLQTYRAQAVAARTYALYEMATRGRGGAFDVWDSQRSQAYGGMLSETDKSWRATRDTHAWVLAYGPPGRQRIFLSQFSACNGGWVNGAHVLRDVTTPIPPLQGGQKDPDGQSCPHYTWPPVQIPKTDLYRALGERYSRVAKLGGMETLRIAESTPYGRAIWIEVVAPDGRTARVRAESIRYALRGGNVDGARGIKSMNCKLRDTGEAIEFYDGRGFGHGVGLSQWGAEDKARQGISAEQILQFYYPGASIFRAY